MLGSSRRAARKQQALPDVHIAQRARGVLHPEAAQAHGRGCQQLRRALRRRHDACQQPLQRALGPMQGMPAARKTPCWICKSAGCACFQPAEGCRDAPLTTCRSRVSFCRTAHHILGISLRWDRHMHVHRCRGTPIVPCICSAAFFPVPAEQLSREDGAQKVRQQLHALGVLPALLQPICIVSEAQSRQSGH